MTLGDLLRSYLNKETDAIQTIRTLTAMFNPDHAIDILVIVNQITRLEQGDQDTETFKELFKL